MTIHRPFVSTLLAVALAIATLGFVQAHEAGKPDAQEEFDTEHIFGFTEGTDIGEKGEKELESTNEALFGKPGRYVAIGNETAFRYVIVDSFRVSLGGLFDYHDIHDVRGFADRNAFDFAGISSEFRWHPVERTETSPGVTLSFAPQWLCVDDISGATEESYAVSMELLLDGAPIPRKLFWAFNGDYEPSITRVSGGWEHSNFLELSIATAYAVTPSLLFGAEIRHLSAGAQGLFSAQALFAGPSVYYKLTDTVAIKAALSIQVPDETTHRLDLVSFERYEALLQLVKGF